MEQLSRQARRALERKQKKQKHKESTAIKSGIHKVDRYGWIPDGEVLRFAGRIISGMVYVYNSKDSNEHKYSTKKGLSCIIDTALPVVSPENLKNTTLKITLKNTCYELLDANARGLYLYWLENGCSSDGFNPNFAMIYFYGLEQRFMFDKSSKQEKEEIVREVERMKQLCRGVSLYCNKMNYFLNTARDILFCNWMLPNFNAKVRAQSIKIMETWYRISIGKPVPGEYLVEYFHFAKILDYLEEPPIKDIKLFDKLFIKKFKEKYPKGVTIEIQNRKLIFMLNYRSVLTKEETWQPVYYKNQILVCDETLKSALSNDFLDGEVVNGERVKLMDLVNETKSELEDEFQTEKKKQDLLNSKTLLDMMPDELKIVLGDNPYTRKQEKLLSVLVSLDKNKGTAPLSDIYNQFWDNRATSPSWFNWTLATSRIARLGFGLAPNIELNFKVPAPTDQCTSFKIIENDSFDGIFSESYKSAVFSLSLGAFIAKSEKLDDKEILDLLGRGIQRTEGLTASGLEGLKANLKLVPGISHDKGYLRRMSKHLKQYPELIKVLRSTIKWYAHARNGVNAEAVSVIEKVYKSVGLDPKTAYTDLHAREEFGISEGIKKNKEGIAELNEERVNSIRSDTEKVSKVLGDIFTVDDALEIMQNDSNQEKIVGLDSKHAKFLNSIVKQEHWSEEEFSTLARENGLFPSGALETINEWAYERYEDILIEEHDGFNIMSGIAGKLKTEIEGGLAMESN